jgi:hypothetical protein
MVYRWAQDLHWHIQNEDFPMLSFIASLTLALPLPSPLTPSLSLAPDVDRQVDSQHLLTWMETPTYLEHDASWTQAQDPQLRRFQFRHTTVFRLQPKLPSPHGLLRVEGADRVLTFRHGVLVDWAIEAPLMPQGEFRISDKEAMGVAIDSQPKSIIRHRHLSRSHSLGERVWLVNHGVMRPAWRLRVLTMRVEDLRDVWVDAHTGKLLKTQTAARLQSAGSAKVFNYSPTSTTIDSSELQTVELPEVIDAPDGSPLVGNYFRTNNCCKYFSCPNLDEEACNIIDPGTDSVSQAAYQASVADRQCESEASAGQSFESRLLLRIPTEILQDVVPITLSGDTLYANTVFCTEAPRLQRQSDDWLADPVDGSASDAETDAFVEAQVYYTSQSFFSHVKDVMGDTTFCLESPSMQCDDEGSPVMGTAGSNPLDPSLAYPLRPFHITTNFILPEINLSSLGTQILLSGSGTSEDTPVTINAYQRFGNAAFIPATEGGAIGFPPELAPLAELFNRPFDSNLYAQGERDFAYDGDVVAHEFTHALVHTLQPNLGSLGVDTWGSHAFPGALNEGWADYFASSFTDDSVMGEYLEAGGIRNIDNDAQCPTALTGEVHDDSLPWSGALWALRNAVAQNDRAALDALLLSTIAQAATSETFDAQAQKILTALAADTSLTTYISAAEQAFQAHTIIDCERVVPLLSQAGTQSHTHATMHQGEPAAFGLDNYAPSPLQFSVEIPAGATGFNLTWTQSAGGMIGAATGGQGSSSEISAVIQEGTPVTWSYAGSLAQPSVTGFDPSQSLATLTTTQSGQDALIAHTLSPDCSQSRTFYISLVSTSGSAVLSDMASASFPIDISCGAGAPGGDPEPNSGSGDPGSLDEGGCRQQGSSSVSWLAFWGVILIFWGKSRRRRLAIS